MIVCCNGCQKPITGKFLVTVLERTWHAECVRCSDCGCALTDKCFSREGKLFCRPDFFRSRIPHRCEALTVMTGRGDQHLLCCSCCPATACRRCPAPPAALPRPA
ncbi:LIM/homeobox protein Lhx5 [Portunus trituberculatus]|uniref:LIM/homeobox protein Lhx5 n=1 Tax=Portunus trituberculatus TaxID=210409 RepID=A0A5B7H6E6_PORTR|nr:LIM/homeobox protein Lhx5 [Portunus trituberculatus]